MFRVWPRHAHSKRDLHVLFCFVNCVVNLKTLSIFKQGTLFISFTYSYVYLHSWHVIYSHIFDGTALLVANQKLARELTVMMSYNFYVVDIALFFTILFKLLSTSTVALL